MDRDDSTSEDLTSTAGTDGDSVDHGGPKQATDARVDPLLKIKVQKKRLKEVTEFLQDAESALDPPPGRS